MDLILISFENKWLNPILVVLNKASRDSTKGDIIMVIVHHEKKIILNYPSQ